MSTSRWTAWRAVWLGGAALALALPATGCFGTRQISTPVYDHGEIRSYVRVTKRGSEVIPRGFKHPAVIASVRLAHALSFIDVEEKKGKKQVDRRSAGAVHERGNRQARRRDHRPGGSKKAGGQNRTDNLRFTKPLLCH